MKPLEVADGSAAGAFARSDTAPRRHSNANSRHDLARRSDANSRALWRRLDPVTRL
jgi:hypothetical protein